MGCSILDHELLGTPFQETHICFGLMVWNSCYFSIYREESSQLTFIFFQRGWNHQPIIIHDHWIIWGIMTEVRLRTAPNRELTWITNFEHVNSTNERCDLVWNWVNMGDTSQFMAKVQGHWTPTEDPKKYTLVIGQKVMAKVQGQATSAVWIYANLDHVIIRHPIHSIPGQFRLHLKSSRVPAGWGLQDSVQLPYI